MPCVIVEPPPLTRTQFFSSPGEVFSLTEGLLMGDPVTEIDLDILSRLADLLKGILAKKAPDGCLFPHNPDRPH
jgi:hypothetical protein